MGDALARGLARGAQVRSAGADLLNRIQLKSLSPALLGSRWRSSIARKIFHPPLLFFESLEKSVAHFLHHPVAVVEATIVSLNRVLEGNPD